MAVQSAKQNVELNNVQDKVSVSQGNLLDGVNEQADIVVANILAEVIMRFTDDVAKVVKPGGFFIASGIIQTKKQDVKEAIIASGFTVEGNDLDGEDWVAIIAKRNA